MEVIYSNRNTKRKLRSHRKYNKMTKNGIYVIYMKLEDQTRRLDIELIEVQKRTKVMTYRK